MPSRVWTTRLPRKPRSATPSAAPPSLRRSPARRWRKARIHGGPRVSGPTTAGARPHYGGRRPGAGWSGRRGNGRGGPLGPAPAASAWDAGPRWTDERLAAERARSLRRLGRFAEAAEAWQGAAGGGGGGGGAPRGR